MASPAFAQDNSRQSGQKRGPLLALAFSPEGSKLVVGGDSLRVYEVQSGKPLHEWFPPPLTRVVAWSPVEPDVVIEGGERGEIRFWRMAEEQPFRAVRVHTERVNHLALSPEGKLAVSTANTVARDRPGYDEFRLWDLATGEVLRAIDMPHLDGRLTCAAFSTDGRLVGLARLFRDENAPSRIDLYEPQSWKWARRHIFSKGFAEALVFHPDGRQLLIAGGEQDRPRFAPPGKLWLRRAGADDAFELDEPNPSDVFHAAAFVPGGERFAVVTSKATGRPGVPTTAEIQMRETRSGKVLWSMVADDDRPQMLAVAVSPDGKLIACCTFATVFILDSDTGAVIHRLRAGE